MSLGLYFDLLERSHIVDVRQSRARNFSTRMRNDAFDMSDDDFIKCYRLSKDLVTNLVDELTPLMPESRRKDGIDIETKVLVALAFFATGSYQNPVGLNRVHAVSQPTVSRCIRQVIQAMNHPSVIHKYISFPLTREGREKLKREFYKECKIPGIVGVIDGTHVAIIRPKEHEERFFNRKGYHSLNVLIICDSDLQILSMDSSHPGSTHDSTAWKHHRLHNYLSETYDAGEKLFLLGDSGYPLRKTMMTPILNTMPGTPDAHYYALHVSARNTVERCIGILKARFRCLLVARALHYDPVTAAEIVNACCILHNIAHKARLYVPPLSPAEAQAELAQQIQQQAGEGEMQIQTSVEYNLLLNDPQNRRVNRELLLGRANQNTLVQHLWAERVREGHQ